MQLDTVDILTNICLKLENRDIRSLCRSSSKILEAMKKIYANQNFWFLRVRLLACSRSIDLLSGLEIVCWRNVYTCLSRSINNKWKASDDRRANEMSLLIHIEIGSYDERRLFDIACREGYVEVMKKLLSNTEMNVSNKSLYVACTNERLEIVRLLLESKRIDPRTRHSELVRACIINKMEVASLLLEDRRIDPHYQSSKYIRVGRPEDSKIRLLPYHQGRTSWAISITCENERYEIVELLLEDRRVLKTLDSMTWKLRWLLLASVIGLSLYYLY
jgi:hypothetical protein